MPPIVLLLLAASASAEPDAVDDDDVGERLILTPYIDAGMIQEARKLSSVPPLHGSHVSYSGFVTVNKNCDSNLFFWYFPAEIDSEEAPVAVWLQGGPGATSMYGVLTEVGPYNLSAEHEFQTSNYSWTRVANLLFVDSPVGTGYSYTTHPKCYAKNQVMVGRDLLSALKQILKLFPEVATNPLYLTGESYAGKYIPALGHAILKDKDTKQKINLQGLAIGNGLVDPLNQVQFSKHLYQIGLLDDKGKAAFNRRETICRGFIYRNMWVRASLCFDRLIAGQLSPYPTLFTNLTGYDFYYNFLHEHGPPEANPAVYMTQSHIRKSIHVGNATWNDEEMVKRYLLKDAMQSVRPWLEKLADRYRVLIYTGQLDIIVTYPLVVSYIKRMNWSGSMEYRTAPRVVWKVDGDVAGYAKTAGKLTEVLVRNAGHLVPTDQPKWAFDMISRFFKNKSFN